MRLALLLMMGGAAAFIALVFSALSTGTLDVDRYSVLDVVSDPSLNRHAVIYRHEHVGSRTRFTVVWITTGSTPAKGDKDRPRGLPAAIWSSGAARMGWASGQLRIIGDHPRVYRGSLGAAHCYEEHGAWDLCIDPVQVTFVPLPR